jgi:hypothetical protein
MVGIGGDSFRKPHDINDHFKNLNWRYLPDIRPIFQAYVREYPHKIWPYMVRLRTSNLLDPESFPIDAIDSHPFPHVR